MNAKLQLILCSTLNQVLLKQFFSKKVQITSLQRFEFCY